MNELLSLDNKIGNAHNTFFTKYNNNKGDILSSLDLLKKSHKSVIYKEKLVSSDQN